MRIRQQAAAELVQLQGIFQSFSSSLFSPYQFIME